MDEYPPEAKPERSPGMKLLFAAIIGAALMVPLLMVYALVYDRQNQSAEAQASINAGWGGAQVVAGPVLVVPYTATVQQTDIVNGRSVTRAVEVDRSLAISPTTNRVLTQIAPQERRKSIYSAVLFEADVSGKATFSLPEDLERFGVSREDMAFDRAVIRVGVADARGLTTGGRMVAEGDALDVQPGTGPGSTGSDGFFAFLEWDGEGELAVDYSFGLRGSRSIGLVPRGGQTTWAVSSPWPNPSFTGAFLPETRQITDAGFEANYTVDKLALGQPPVMIDDAMMTGEARAMREAPMPPPPPDMRSSIEGPQGSLISVELVEMVDLYSKVDRAVKYGFLFIGFTFLAFFLFDVLGGARVAAAEYLLTGAGLVLFFVLLLAFAEVVGFTLAYLIASGAIIGLLTAYSAAVLGSWKRARFIAALLVGLYALLFVLLNLEAWSLLIGAVLLFVALAGVMFVTRKVDWSAVSARRESLEA